MRMHFLKKRNFNEVRETSNNSGLHKTLKAFDLILMGLGAIIGTGVFVLTGMVAAKYSGPAVTLSYIIGGLTCIFVALAYTELASMLPTSGSVYTYSYVAFGEIFAWLVGAVIILELTFAASTVATGWSAYMQGLIAAAGIELPQALTAVPAHGGVINLPAVLILMFVSFILFLGTTESKKLNAFLVFIKLGAIFAFIVTAIPHFDVTNFDDFMPFGFDEVLVGASILFFAYTGFGTLATAAEECENPKRDLTIGIVGSLVLSTTVYVIISGLAVGIEHYSMLNNPQPLSRALVARGSQIGSAIVATGAICGMITVMMMQLYGQSRIAYVMARDRLLPSTLGKLHPKYESPYVAIIVFSSISIFLAAFFPYETIAGLASMGALIDYSAVALAVIVFRFTRPEAERPFKCPMVFVIAPIALLSCLYLLFKQILKQGKLLLTGELLIYWLVLFAILYVLRMIYINRKHKK